MQVGGGGERMVDSCTHDRVISNMAWYITYKREVGRSVLLLKGGFPRVLFPPLWCFPPAVSGWGSVWVGLTPTMI